MSYVEYIWGIGAHVNDTQKGVFQLCNLSGIKQIKPTKKSLSNEFLKLKLCQIRPKYEQNFKKISAEVIVLTNKCHNFIYTYTRIY